MIRKLNPCSQATWRVIVLLDSCQPGGTATKAGLRACLCHSWNEWQKSNGNFVVIKFKESYWWTQSSLCFFPPLLLIHTFLFPFVIFFFNIVVVELCSCSSQFCILGEFVQFFPLVFWQCILFSFIGLLSRKEWVLCMLFPLLPCPAP